jgi:adenine-specific DNA-methyltransferase
VAQPWREAAANHQLTLFEQQNPRVDDLSPAETLRERNRLVWGDNKLVMASLLQEFKGKVDLIYIDPPFDVSADFSRQVQIGDEKDSIQEEQSTLEMVAYRDTWGRGTDSYLFMMYERLSLMKELLSETGSIYVHCDYRTSSYLKLILIDVFGSNDEFNRSEIIWKSAPAHSDSGHLWGDTQHDFLFFKRREGFLEPTLRDL